MSNTNEEKIAVRGVIYVTIAEILAILFFVMINGGF